jgi:cytochrome P450
MSTRFDIFSAESMDAPDLVYSEIRRTSPVCQVDPDGWWAVSRHEDVVFVLKHPELFSSAGRSGARDAILDPRLAKDPIFAEEGSIITSDPPAHGRLRRLISGAFAPRAMQRLEDRVRRLAAERVDELVGKARFDLMADLAVPFPVIVIAEMLGVDPADRGDFKRWSDDAINVQPGRRLDDDEVERILRGRREFRAYFEAMIAARRRSPREDLISDLCRAEAGEEGLQPDEVLAMTLLLLIAGNETTTNLLGNGTLALLDHPEAMRRLREDPALIPGFIEEVLRYDGPVKLLLRRATRDVMLSGITIPEDAVVVALLAAANRDPEAFPDPDRFDITRQGRGHVTFGHGIHFCVGAPLSRLEGKLAFGEMLRRLPPFSREPGALQWTSSLGLRGLKTLPLRLDLDPPGAPRRQAARADGPG